MWRFLVIVLCYQVLSQPVTDELSRQPREIIECCPCPSHGSEDTLGRSSQLGRESVDDCPCRARSVDSEGASSILIPSSVRPDGPHIRPFNSKEEVKNLLKPEVGLATSMLQTLREATEEEYRDALARDAARSAAGLDGNADESKNLVIIVNPRSSEDDTFGEASHIQESRCAHPLASSMPRLRTLATEPDLLPDILKLPKLRRPGLPHRNLLDMDSSVGASNVEEKLVGLNNDPLVAKPKPSLLRSNFPLKSKLFPNINEENSKADLPVSKSPTSLLRSSIPFKTKLFKNPDDNTDSKILSTLKSPLLSKPKIKSLFDGLKPLVPMMKANSPLEKEDDLNTAPNTVQEVLDNPDKKLSGSSGLLVRRPPMLKNLWKLKDVELLPPTMLAKKPVLKLPKATVPLLRNTYAKDDVEDNASGETKYVKKSEVNLRNKLENVKFSDRLRDANNENCTDDINVQNNQNQDLSQSPSNVFPFALATTETSNIPEERDVSSIADTEPLLAVDFSKSTEDENMNIDSNCQVTSEPKFMEKNVQNDSNSEIESIENLENSEVPLKDVDVTSRENPIDQDSLTDTSNINSVVVEPNSKLEDPISGQIDDNGAKTNPLTDSVDEVDVPHTTIDTSVPNSLFKPIPSLSDTLSAIRDNIQKLDFFINPSKTLTSEEINDDIAKFENENNEKSSTDNSDFISKSYENSDIIGNDDEETKSIVSSEQNESNSVTLEDLQKLSDDLLDSSSNQEQKISTSTEINNEQPEPLSNLQEANKEIDTDSDKTKNEPSPVTTQEEIERNDHNSKENVCPDNVFITPEPKHVESSQVKSLDLETEPLEMKASASEPIISTLPNILDPLNLADKLKLPYQNKIVQPSLPILPDPLKLLNNPLDDIIDLNPKLPTLDDIREQISNVFSTDERSANESQEECDYDEEEIEKMAPRASNTNSQIKLPAINPKDNSDLFQLASAKPSQRNTQGNNQKINLNSYRAKVPAPKSIELKPIKFEPNFRSKDGVLRTPLKLNTDRRPIARTKISNSKLPNKSILLGDPALHLPTLDQLKDALETSPSRLLGNPLQPNLNIFRSNPISDISDDIRLNAEKTVKSLQKKMRTSLRRPQLAEPLAKPQDLLEDVGDKLKAIHYDLNDRLASVHDDILDTSRLQLPTNLFKSPDLLNKKFMTNLRTTKPKSLRMQTLASSISSRNGPEIKPITRKIATSQVKVKTPSKLFKNQDVAASAPTPVKLESPKLRKEIDKFPIQRLSERTVPSIDPIFKSSVPKPVFRKPNFKDSRVTITFGSTTPPSLRSADVPVKNPTPRKNDISLPKFKANPLRSRLIPSSKSALDQRPQVTKTTLTPFKFPSKFKELDGQQKDTSRLKFIKKNPVFSSFDPRNKANDGIKLKSLGDAVQERLSNFDSFTHSKSPTLESSDKPQVKVNNVQSNLKSNSDMLRSASENTDIIVSQEPLKENVSYKCKLVCTKENI